jgi:hypothetical protein
MATDGAVALSAASGSATAPTLSLVTPAGAVLLVVGGRRDAQPIGRPAFVPGGNENLFFFLTQNLDLPLDRNNRPLVGLFRGRLVNGSPVVEPVAQPGEPVPTIPGLAPNTVALLLGLTQRPVVTVNAVTFGVRYGVQDKSSPLSPLDYLRTLPVPAAALFQIPLLGTLATGHAVAPEGAVVTGTAKLAQVRALSFRADHTLDALALLPGAGPVIVPSTAPAGVASVARTQALPPAAVQPLLATGDALGLGSSEMLEFVLPPLLALGASQELFVARFTQAGGEREGYFTLGPSGQHVQPVQTPFAVTSMGATADTIFNHFSYAATNPLPDRNILDPPSIFADGGALNVVFKALLNGKPGTSLMASVFSGVFQWIGSNAVNAVDLSTGSTPVTLEHWAAGKAGAVYFQARDASRSHLYRRAAPGAAVALLMAAENLTDLSDFVVSADGNALFVIGKDRTGSRGLFRLDLTQNSLTPLRTTAGSVAQGQPVPAPAIDPGATGLKLTGDFTVDPASGQGPLLFYATLQPQRGGSTLKRGLFQLDPNGQLVVPQVIEDLAEGSARNLTASVLQDMTALNNTRGTLAFADAVNGLWVIWRERAKFRSPGQPDLDSQGNQIYLPPEPVAQGVGPHGERRGDLNGVAAPLFTALDASLMLSTPDQPSQPGPVFVLGEDDGVAFLATDGKRWGVYRTAE